MPRATSKAIEALALAWRRAKTSWRALVMATLIATVLAALIASEQWLESVRGYWIGHPMLAALTASAVTLAVTVLIVDALVRSRETRRWEVVAQAAYRELSTDAFEFYAALLHRMGLEGEEMRFGEEQPILSERFHATLDTLLDSAEGHVLLADFIYDHTERLGRSIARWAPVMLQTADLKALTLFAEMRDTLISAKRGFQAVGEPHWRWGFWTSLEYFFLLFAHFDGMRRRALGEPLVLGSDEADYRAAWGLPRRDTPADLGGS